MNRCKKHPNLENDFFCVECKEFYCDECCENDKKQRHHDESIFVLSKRLKENYDFLEYLGGGSFGSVFKVKNFNSNDELAIKIIKCEDQTNDEIIAKEAEIMCLAKHENIVKFKNCEKIREENIFVIYMEFAPKTLFSVINNLNHDDAFNYFTQICEAVYYLHEEKNIIHRDLKPDNILIINNQIKLGDFGISKTMTGKNTNMNKNAKQYGTPDYQAPEIFQSKTYNKKVDIWALGIIFHQMLSQGSHPFQQGNEMIQNNIYQMKMTISKKITKPLYKDILKG